MDCSKWKRENYCKHTVIAGKSGIQLIEVQLGDEICVVDKNKFEFDF